MPDPFRNPDRGALGEILTPNALCCPTTGIPRSADGVQPRMLRSCHNLKVIWRVVHRVFVNVVNHLRAAKHSPQLNFHHRSVLKKFDEIISKWTCHPDVSFMALLSASHVGYYATGMIRSLGKVDISTVKNPCVVNAAKATTPSLATTDRTRWHRVVVVFLKHILESTALGFLSNLLQRRMNINPLVMKFTKAVAKPFPAANGAFVACICLVSRVDRIGVRVFLHGCILGRIGTLQ